MLNTVITSQSGKKVTFKSPYTTTCNGVKKTSNVKVNTPHKLDKQFNVLAAVIDKKPNGFVARKKALKAK